MKTFVLCSLCRRKLCQLYLSKLLAWRLRASTTCKYSGISSPRGDNGENLTETVLPHHSDDFPASRNYLHSTDTYRDNCSPLIPAILDDHRYPDDIRENRDDVKQNNANTETPNLDDVASRISEQPTENKTKIADPKISYYEASNLSLRFEQNRVETKSGKFQIRFTNVHPEFNPVASRSHSQNHPLNDGLESMFRETIAQSNFPNTINNPISNHLDQVNLLTTMISKNRPLSETWKYFRETFHPDTLNKFLLLNFKRCLHSLLQAIIISKRQSPFDSTVPSIAEVADVYIQFNYLSGNEWADLVTSLLGRVVLIKNLGADDKNKKLISEILDAWHVACRKPRESTTPLSLDDAQSLYKEYGVYSVFRTLVPQLINRDLKKIPLVAIATFSILTSDLVSDQSSKLDVTPLVQKIATILSIPNLEIDKIVFAENDSVLKSFVLKNWVEIQKIAQRISGITGEVEVDAEKSQSLEDQMPIKLSDKQSAEPSIRSNVPIRGIDFIHHRLRSAINLKNHMQVDQLWLEVSSWPVLYAESNVGTKTRDGFLSLEICNQFILAYMKFQRPKEAIKVWNFMIEKELKPTTKTWNVLMSGCRNVRDWRSAEMIWDKMIHSGLQPDNISWSTRVSTLIECKEIDMGIRALDEMGRLWLTAAAEKHPKMDIADLQLVEDVKEVSKPDIFCLNAAIAGLLSQGKKAHANQTLIWGRSLGIKPDVVTYNIFLRQLVRNGYKKEAMLLLKRMKKAGVEADIATYTIILDQVLRDPGQYSPEIQREMVNDLFTDMEKVNVKPNAITYGKIIYQLIRNLDAANEPTVVAVLRRMELGGIKPSVQIYTSLVEYFLFQDPPKVDAARQVIDQATLIIGLDRVFWDKVVNCYAQIGDTDTALGIICMLNSKKTRVGWAALRSVLESLSTKKEWDLAKGMVRDVQVNSKLLDFREGTVGEQMFWQLAKKLNLIESIEV